MKSQKEIKATIYTCIEIWVAALASRANNDVLFERAENGIRTRDPQLGKLMLYQLSYFRLRYLF